ncbi:MAG TPA: hypothetical protein VH437_08970 [Terriglobales bacterium]|jgi:hypothetical protein
MEVDSEFLRLARVLSNAEADLQKALAKEKPRLGWIAILMDSLQRKRLELANYMKSHPNPLLFE